MAEYIQGVDESVYPPGSGPLSARERAQIEALEHSGIRLVDCVRPEDVEDVRVIVFGGLVELEIFEEALRH